jgi:hypothetical protein
MLHDPQISGPDRGSRSDERRRATRTAVEAELVVRWHHDPETPVRYPVLDLGDGGARILSTTPLRRGLSGTAVKLLPQGTTIHRMCTVSWTRPPPAARRAAKNRRARTPADDGSFEIGLRFA